MKERIGELYTKALKYADSKVPAERRYNDIYYAIVSGKHAELIVRECAQVSEDDITDGDACCTNTAYRIAGQIKKHFGVE